ncbi:uncharacterized protein [Antedon mediterranea]|uniref:uncharacterized protein n=1 Tax=Antedon mediterranea TaxID=105859 RepID=UPI003AF59195
MLYIVIVSVILCLAQGNQNDPHVFPEEGPFVEGWYARLVDEHMQQSYGVLFGRVLNYTDTEYPLTYLGILKSSNCTGSISAKEAYPDLKDISVKLNGTKEVDRNPAFYSPPPANFIWKATQNGYFNVSENQTNFDFTIEEIRLEGKFGKPTFWKSDGTGPEGWLGKLPFLPLHWFVYSPYTFGQYTWTNTSSGETIHGSAFMHQEKNWGEGFPPAWVWTQAVKPGAAVSGSFGVIQFVGYVDIPAHLFGYRNYNKSIELDLRVDNSLLTNSIDGCKGIASFTINSIYYRVVYNVTAPVATLGTCLRGPTAQGFKPVLVESYQATTILKIYKRKSIFQKFSEQDVIDQQTFQISALEFGGRYLCHENPCKQKRNINSSYIYHRILK